MIKFAIGFACGIVVFAWVVGTGLRQGTIRWGENYPHPPTGARRER